MDVLSRICCGGSKEQRITESNSKSWRVFTLKELQVATSNFSHKRKLGEGGFGSVFYGKLSDGSKIAVKKLKVWSVNNELAFSVEVETLGRAKHKNLLRLLGYCAEGQERLIVYDFMQNLCLVSHLHGKHSTNSVLDWRRRMSVVLGSAEGLEYLHHDATPHIIHRDVKASNVLLDSDFEAKVADFGFAKFIPDGVTHLTTRVKGTVGYLAPEYAMWGRVSESCDVYSFGILLLEIISGKKPIEKLPNGEKRTIVEWAVPLVYQGRLEALLDPKLVEKVNGDELRRMVQIASLCAQTNPEKRPTMREVVSLLRGALTLNLASRRTTLEAVKYNEELLAADDYDDDDDQ